MHTIGNFANSYLLKFKGPINYILNLRIILCLIILVRLNFHSKVVHQSGACARQFFSNLEANKVTGKYLKKQISLGNFFCFHLVMGAIFAV